MNRKLSDTQIQSIYALSEGRKLYVYELAELFGVHPNTIYQVLRGHVWKELYQRLEHPEKIVTGNIRRQNLHHVALDRVYLHVGHQQHAIVSIDDWPEVQKHRWFSWCHPKSKIFYCLGNISTTKGVFTSQYLHHYVAGKGVRWRNKNQLDCRRENLVVKN